jgi:hypothetical protein
MNTNLKRALLGVTATALIASGAISAPANAASPLSVTVSKTTNLSLAGESVNVSVTGIPLGQKIYVFQCATNSLSPRPYLGPPGTPGNKCGSSRSGGLWLSTPAINDGSTFTFTTEASAPNSIRLERLLVVGDSTYDCAKTACSIFVMRDKDNFRDVSLDSLVPISFLKPAAPLQSSTPVNKLTKKVSKTIMFSGGKSSVMKSAKRQLRKEIANYKIASQVVITATAGSTVGASDKVVKSLAKKRANAIKKYLVAQGVPAEKIVIKAKIAKPGKKPSTRVVATP